MKAILITLISLSVLSCIPECDETVEIYNNNYEVIGWECVTYNN